MQRSNMFGLDRCCLMALMGAMMTLHTSGCFAAKVPPAQPAAGGFAVVELFTSEGCSSCPPADDLLGEIAGDSQRRGVAIFPISMHIDYWDGLGWRDRFSLAAATERQQQYAKALGAQIYTPQMVINGRAQFVGSDRDAYRRAVGEALATAATAHLTIALVKGTDSEVAIRYSTPDAPPDSLLNLVLIQRSASTDVPRGENAGHTLHHVNIARLVQTIVLSRTSGETSLKLPPDLLSKDAIVVGYIQNPHSLEILAASRVDATATSKPAQ